MYIIYIYIYKMTDSSLENTLHFSHFLKNFNGGAEVLSSTSPFNQITERLGFPNSNILLHILISVVILWFILNNTKQEQNKSSMSTASSKPSNSSVSVSSSKPSVSKPSVSKPSVSKPSASKPSASKPSVSKTSVSKTSVSKTSVSKTSASKTSASKPLAARKSGQAKYY